MSVTEVASAKPDSESTAEACPRCHSTTPWGENSWCPDCGYYPTVDSGSLEGRSWADDLPEVVQEVEDTRTALESIPGWFWGMIAGIVGITLVSVAFRLLFSEDEDIRGTIALIQLSIGSICLLTAHLIAAKSAMKHDRRLNAIDILLAWFNVWQPTIVALPKTSKRLLSAVWGGIAVLTAVTIIGGIDYAAPFRTEREAAIKPMALVGAIAGAARAQAAKDDGFTDMQSQLAAVAGADAGGETGPAKSLEDAFDELGDVTGQLPGAGDMSPEDLAKLMDSEAERPTLNCFVYGVVIDSRNVPVAFLFAANTKGEDQHVAEVPGKDLDPDLYKSIVMKLYKAIQSKPEVPTERKAVWVRPIVTCRLNFDKLTENGELDDPEVEAIVVEQRGRFDTSENRPSRPTQRQPTQAQRRVPSENR